MQAGLHSGLENKVCYAAAPRYWSGRGSFVTAQRATVAGFMMANSFPCLLWAAPPGAREKASLASMCPQCSGGFTRPTEEEVHFALAHLRGEKLPFHLITGIDWLQQVFLFIYHIYHVYLVSCKELGIPGKGGHQGR